MKPHELRIRRLHLIQVVCAVLGLALSFYLLLHHTRVKLGIQDSSSFCSFGRLADCDIVNVSRYSEVAGVPLAALGAFYFFFLLLMGLIAPPRNRNFPAVKPLLAWLSTLAFIIDLGLLVGIQWLQLGSFCLLCILTYLANLGYWLASFAQTPTGSHRWREFFWGKTPGHLKKISGLTWGILVTSLVAFGILLTFLPAWLETGSDNWGQKQRLTSEFLKNWNQLPVKNFSSDPLDGSWGPENAKTHVVVFSDFQCPFCKKAAFSLHTLLPSFKKEVRVTFKHFPLDPSCNSGVTHRMHPYACSLARLGVCAQKKNRFWEFHDTVFLKIKESVFEEGWDKVREQIIPILSENEIEECLKSDESLQKVQSDIESGFDAGIQGTPALFLNGKAVTIPLDLEVMRKLMDLEAAAVSNF